MCRLLLVENPAGIDPNPFLARFRQVCRDSLEYQVTAGAAPGWTTHAGADLPLDRTRSGTTRKRIFPATSAFLAHARSALP